MAKFLKDKNTYANKFPTSMKKGGKLKKYQGTKGSSQVKATRKPGTYNLMDAKDILGKKTESVGTRILKAPGRAAAFAVAKPIEMGVRAAERMSGKTYKKGGFPDLTGDGKVTRADVLKGRGVFKKGGSIMKTAGKTTTGVTSNYKGYKGPKSKPQIAKVKKAKGKL